MECIFLLAVSGYLLIDCENGKKRNFALAQGWELVYSALFRGFFPLAFTVVIGEILRKTLPLFILEYFSFLFKHHRILALMVLNIFFTFLWVSWKKNQDKKVPDADITEINYRGTKLFDQWAELLNRPAQISLKNGKVYVGKLTKVELDEKVPFNERVVVLLMMFSGMRDPQGKVDLTTRYPDFPIHLTIFQGEVVSFTQFDPKAHQLFIGKPGTEEPQGTPGHR